MAGRKADQKGPEKKSSLVVTAAFAYASKPDGEVVQLVKGDVVDPAKFTKQSVEHLESIGLIGASDN